MTAWMKHFQGNISWAPGTWEEGLAFVGWSPGSFAIPESMNSDLFQSKKSQLKYLQGWGTLSLGLARSAKGCCC